MANGRGMLSQAILRSRCSAIDVNGGIAAIVVGPTSSARGRPSASASGCALVIGRSSIRRPDHCRKWPVANPIQERRDALRRRARHRLDVYLAVSVGPAATSIDAVLAGPSRTLRSCFSSGAATDLSAVVENLDGVIDIGC